MRLEDVNWWDKAACKGQDVNLFYPEEGASSVAPKEFCLKCTVRQECMDDAIRHETPTTRHGVWGGMSSYDRENAIDGRKRRSYRRKTHCAKGRHELTLDNILLIKGRAKVRCKACTEERRLAYAMAPACVNGHPWTSENSYFDSKGRRSCRECRRQRSLAWKVRNEARNNGHQQKQVRQDHQQVVCEGGEEVASVRAGRVG